MTKIVGKGWKGVGGGECASKCIKIPAQFSGCHGSSSQFSGFAAFATTSPHSTHTSFSSPVFLRIVICISLIMETVSTDYDKCISLIVTNILVWLWKMYQSKSENLQTPLHIPPTHISFLSSFSFLCPSSNLFLLISWLNCAAAGGEWRRGRHKKSTTEWSTFLYLFLLKET